MNIKLKNRGRIDRRSWVKFFIHFIVICILIVLPELLFNYSHPHWRAPANQIFNMYFKAGVFVVVFYIEYYLILPKTLLRNGRGKILWFVVGNFILLLVAVLLIYYIQHLTFEGIGRPRFHEPTRKEIILKSASFMLRDGAMLILIIGLSVAIRFGENWQKLEHKHAQLVASQKAEELESLKSQLNPHFLFNTLNTIYALIAISPDKAQQAVHELSALLRYALYENPETVKISQEVNFVKNYISLMEMRLGEGRLITYFRVDNDVNVAPLLFVALIENAIKHGNTGKQSHKIEISLESDSHGNVTCMTRNHFTPKPKDAGKTNSGIGLSNLRRRLHLIYKDKAQLTTNTQGDIFEAILTIKTSEH